MRFRIFTRAYDEIVAHAGRDHPREACGLLFGRDGAIETAAPVANIAAAPDRAFEIDPALLLHAQRTARDSGSTWLGWYHSHPGGAPTPSVRDSERAAEEGRLWLIAAGGAVHGFMAREGGAIHGRFAPIQLDILS